MNTISLLQQNKFLQEIVQLLLLNLEDPNYGIENLCEEMSTSRSSLHRKVRAYTGRKTSHFIRSVRLGKAKELLADPKMNVSEVAYAVGFKYPSYFTRVFREEFDISPLSYRDKLLEGKNSTVEKNLEQ